MLVYMFTVYLIFYFNKDCCYGYGKYEGGVSTFGTIFHLAFPESHPRVNCSLYTKEFVLFYVNLKVAWYIQSVEPSKYPVIMTRPSYIIFDLPWSAKEFIENRFSYILDAEKEFQVLCYSVDSRNIPNSIMRAVPVHGFGKVYVVPTIPFQPSVQIISGRNELVIRLEITYTTASGQQGKTFFIRRDLKSNIISIAYRRTINIDFCKWESLHTTVTGGVITGSGYFGVVVGACVNPQRLNKTDKCSPDTGLDMLLPVTSYFKSFIVALPRSIPANIILAFTAVTEITVDSQRIEESKSTEFSRDLGEYKGIHVITVSRGTYVFVVLNSPCPSDPTRKWKVMFNSIVPSSLFIDTYLWLTPDSKSLQQSVLVVFKRQNQYNILLDGVNIRRTLGPDKYEATVRQRSYFAFVDIDCTPGYHQLYSINANKFGAYLYGTVAPRESNVFMTPLSFAANPGVIWSSRMPFDDIEEVPCDVAKLEQIFNASIGDLLDNDCDSLVDEEMADGKDNDYDALIDEDCTLPHTRNGEWSDWEPWQCEKANDQTKHRTRLCNNPPPTNGGFYCFGESSQEGPGNCNHIINGIVDGEMYNVEVDCFCDESLTPLWMAKLKRECKPPKGVEGEPCRGEKEVVAPENSCPMRCLRKEICQFERNSNIATLLDSSYTQNYVSEGFEGCSKTCQSQKDCRGFTVWVRESTPPKCWLFRSLWFGKEKEFFNSYLQKCKMVCGKGYYSTEANLREYATCVKCPVGTYKTITSTGTCLQCPLNWTTPYPGSDSILDCSMVFCAPGLYMNVSSVCEPCKVGTYKTVSGNQACLPCPANRITPAEGSTDIKSCNMQICEPGFFTKDNVSCIECPRGSFKKERGAQPCVPCPSNKTSEAGSVECLIDAPSNRTNTTTVTTTATTASTTSTMTPFTTPTVDPTMTLVFTSFIPMTLKKKYPGKWGSWSEWNCLQNCTVKSVVRTRPCLDPPEGPKDFDCPGFAYQLGINTPCNWICATTCPHGHWGFNCSKTCGNCLADCQKETGECTKCKPGFRNPKSSCSDVCGEMTFGHDCSGDCRSKCEGRDCSDRIEGTCPPKSFWKSGWWYVLLLLLIIPFIICIAKISGRMARKQYEIAEANEHMYLMESDEVVKSEISKSKSEISKSKSEISKAKSEASRVKSNMSELRARSETSV
ncbi:uncharacterized protein LOC106073029 [Biomphalaria glabrata]|uniref:Uncharacterized protein LOC106073029 n=1 Tax=Biomphalaria glabrata TaxID=6526 RepID=A0A9W2Z6R6_BIOGL|nr:uncharacterized protein LOC106073029 [Biomphalaria glabrata]